MRKQVENLTHKQMYSCMKDIEDMIAAIEFSMYVFMVFSFSVLFFGHIKLALVGIVFGSCLLLSDVFLAYIQPYGPFKENSKYYLHAKDLPVYTSIDNIKITNQKALPILTEINDRLIPSYLENKKIYDGIDNLKPTSDEDKQIKQNKMNQIKTNIDNLKQQILSKADQIKDIISHEEFINKYQKLENSADKLNH